MLNDGPRRKIYVLKSGCCIYLLLHHFRGPYLLLRVLSYNDEFGERRLLLVVREAGVCVQGGAVILHLNYNYDVSKDNKQNNSGNFNGNDHIVELLALFRDHGLQPFINPHQLALSLVDPLVETREHLYLEVVLSLEVLVFASDHFDDAHYLV